MIGDLFSLIQDEARKIWECKWLAGGVALLMFAAGALYILRLPDVYDAWGQLYVNKQTPLSAAAAAVDGGSAVGDGYGSPYVVQKTLLNDQSLEEVVRRIDPAAAALEGPALAAAVARLRKGLRVAPDQGDGFVEIHCIDPRPARARIVVQSLLSRFISGNLDRSRKELAKAEVFLDDQIAASTVLVAESQAKLKDLYRRHATLGPTGEGGAPALEVAAPRVQSPGPQGSLAPAARPSAAAERVAALEDRLRSLRTVYTDLYPDVVSTRRQLAEAMTERAREPDPPPMLAGLAPAPRQVAAVRGRRTAPVSPALTAELADALRDDQLVRTKFEQLTARREAVRLSQAVSGSDGSGRFEITRTPTTPLHPTGPKRGLYLALAAAAALGGGLGAAYLWGAVRGVLISPRELQSACQLPVVGTVSLEPAWATGRSPPRASEGVPEMRASRASVFPRLLGGEGRGFS